MHEHEHCVFCVIASLSACAAAVVAQQPPDAAAKVMILRPARVFDGETLHSNWVVRVRGDRIEAAGPVASVASAGGAGARSAEHDAAARADRGAFARSAARLQRNILERSGSQGVTGRPDRARGEPFARDADGRIHDRARSRHRGGRVCRCGAETGSGAGHRPGPADDRHDARDRRDRQLCTERIRVAVAGAAGRRRSGRAGSGPRGARPGGARRRLDQGLCRLSLGGAR